MSVLTDPYDDPETNFQDPKVWARYPLWWQAVLRFNNTMLGRMTVGPVIGQWAFMASDARAIAKGDWQVARGWLLHVPAVVATGVIVFWSAMPLWIYVLAAVGALSILKIRTFLEHRAEEDPTARTVIVEDRGILAFLFLNNSLHVVHHMHPKVCLHALPAPLSRQQGYLPDLQSGVCLCLLCRGLSPVFLENQRPRAASALAFLT